MSMKTIYLHGILAEKFGSKFTLDVFTPLEAIRALCCMIKNFRQEFEKYGYNVIKGELETGWGLDEDTVQLGIGDNEVHFVPVVEGSKAVGKALKSAFKIILGVVLIAAAFVIGIGASVAAGSMSAANFFAGLGFTSGLSLAVTGTLLLIGGIAQATAKTGDASSTASENKNSFTYSGAQNINSQGAPIPLVYGRMRVGSQVVSAGMTNGDISA